VAFRDIRIESADFLILGVHRDRFYLRPSTDPYTRVLVVIHVTHFMECNVDA
jgi:hypothetical protein